MPSRNRSKSRSTEPSSPEAAWQYALRLLTARDYTTARLREKLLARQFAADDAEAAISRLEEGRLLDDRRFAERFASSALESGRFFGPRLKMEMRRRGLAAGMVDEVLAELLAEHDEGENLAAVLERRFPGFDVARADDREKRRVIGFLQRRGFGLGEIFKAFGK